jgi:glucosamine--fructose-6-phosphate aminotransferase (isomerizing)
MAPLRIYGIGRDGDLEQFFRGAANTKLIGCYTGYGSAIMSALRLREMIGPRADVDTGAGFRYGSNWT